MAKSIYMMILPSPSDLYGCCGAGTMVPPVPYLLQPAAVVALWYLPSWLDEELSLIL